MRVGAFALVGGQLFDGTELRTGPVSVVVRERHERGCSVVKGMASGGNLTPGSLPFESQYSRQLLKVVVDETHRLGLPVAAHAHGVPAIEDALVAGVDSIEHASFVDENGSAVQPRLMEAPAAHEVFVNATLGSDPAGRPRCSTCCRTAWWRWAATGGRRTRC